jgi:hypothetical protein
MNRGAGVGVVGVVDNSGSISFSAGWTSCSTFTGSVTGAEETGAGGAGAFGATGASATGAAGFGGAAGGGLAGFAATGAGDAGFAATGAAGLGGAAGAVFCKIAFSASPGFAMCEKSNFGLISSSPVARREADERDDPSPPLRKCAFTFSASSTLIELE